MLLLMLICLETVIKIKSICGKSNADFSLLKVMKDAKMQNRLSLKIFSGGKLHF
jgi:hypothetical protein